MLVGLAAFGQSEDQAGSEDNGFLTNLLENQLSGPGRQIRLSGIQGALSSQARIGQITVADDEGTWLQIDNVELDWSRLALLRGRIEVERLGAERIAILRRPMPVAQPPAPEAEARPFALPELPVSIRLESLGVDEVSFDESVFGQAAELSVEGRLSLISGALDTAIDIERQDAPGGELGLTAAFSNEDRQIALDLELHEPSGGLVADLINIEGEPAIDLSIAGQGPIDNVDFNFDLEANQQRIADGLVSLRGSDAGQQFDVNLSGTLAPLIPAEFRDFFEGETAINVSGLSKAEGGLRIDALGVSGAVLDVDGRLETGPDNFLQSLHLTGALGDAGGPAIVLPVPGAATRIHSARLYVDYGEASRWNGFIVLDRLEAGGLEFEDITLDMGGLARNLQDPETREVTVTLEGLATGVYSPNPDVAKALGSRLDLFADASLPKGAPLELKQFQLTGDSLSVFTAGTLDKLVYDGRLAVRVPDLAILSGLANRELAGGISLRANGSVTPLSGGFDLAFDGSASDLALGDPRLDRVMAGETVLSGRAVRDENGIRTDGLRVENPQLKFASDGRISTAATDIGFVASLSDLALLDPNISGAVSASGRATGSGQPIAVSLEASLPQGRIADKPISDLTLGFDGQVAGRDVTGALTGGGQLDSRAFDLAGDLAVSEQSQSVSGLRVALGPTAIEGDVSRPAEGAIEGQLSVRSPDVGPLAQLAQVEASGSVDAVVTLDAADVGQGVGLKAEVQDLRVAQNAVDDFNADLQVRDAFGLPMVQGTVTASGIAAGGLEIASLNASAESPDAEHMQFSADTRLAIGTLADLSGELQRLPEGFAATLSSLRIRQGEARAELSAPATLTVAGNTYKLTPLDLDLGTGHLTAQGSVSDKLDLQVDIETLPLSLANAIQPQLGLAGSITGNANISGPRDAPAVIFDLSGTGLASSATQAAGLPAIEVQANGRTEGKELDLTASLSGANSLAARAAGKVPLGAEGALDLNVDLQSFPLTLVDRAAGNQGLSGTITGSAQVSGPLADPRVEFNVDGRSLSARILRDNAMPPLELRAAGVYAGAAVTIDNAALNGPSGLNLEASGRVPLAGDGLDVRASGVVPLQLATPLLAQRAASATGTVQLDATATGALTAPQLAGTASLAGGTFTDPATNIRLEDLAVDVRLDGDTVTIASLSTRPSAGGRIEGQGSIGINPAAGFPADLSLRFINVRYTDGALATTRFSGGLALTGPVVGGGGQLSGTIDLGQTEISIPEGFGSAGGVDLDTIQHLQPPPRVVETLRRAGIGDTPESEPARPDAGIGLDITINAPNQFFVRGRGVDAEVGGSLRIQGTTTNVVPIGQFNLRRGRIVILAQRIELTEGEVTLEGDFDPVLNFVAETRSGDVTAIVTVSGRASDPDVTFSSSPELPEDEVLARLLFNRAAADLSPFQLAQLAAAAAELAGVGGGGPGVLSELRNATGLDDLDIVTDDDGATALRAGKYVADNIYVDVQTDSEGNSRAGAVLELTDQITARGSVGSDGNSIFGIFFERDF